MIWYAVSAFYFTKYWCVTNRFSTSISRWIFVVSKMQTNCCRRYLSAAVYFHFCAFVLCEHALYRASCCNCNKLVVWLHQDFLHKQPCTQTGQIGKSSALSLHVFLVLKCSLSKMILIKQRVGCISEKIKWYFFYCLINWVIQLHISFLKIVQKISQGEGINCGNFVFYLYVIIILSRYSHY